MSNQTIKEILSFAVVISIILTVIYLRSESLAEQAVEVEQRTGLNDTCMLKIIQVGESIKEIAPGFYEYTLIQTSEGIEVWVPCTRL